MEKRRELKQQSDALLVERNRLRKALHKRSSSQWALTPRDADISVAAYCLSGYSAEAASLFLKQVGEKNHWPLLKENELIALVEELFLGADLCSLVNRLDMDRKEWDATMASAANHVAEYNLMRWSMRLNAQGVAPSTNLLVEEARRLGCSLPSSVAAKKSWERPSASARMWATRFRRRWGGCVGRVRHAEQMDALEMHGKAHRFAVRL